MNFTRKTEKRFFFHGNAIAFAAHIRRPEDFFILSTARSCLPITGGLAEASENSKSFHDLISFESASSRAIGDYSDPRRAAEFTRGNHADNDLPTLTIVEAAVNGLKIQMAEPAAAENASGVRTVEIKRLRLRMENTSDRRGATAFRSLDADIDGVSVDGHPLKVTTYPGLFAEHDTKQKLEHAFKNSGDFRKRHAHHFFSPEDGESSGIGKKLFGQNELRQVDGVIYCTVVKSIEWANTPAPDCEIIGNHLTVTGLGSLYFGEFIIEEDFRRLTLLRLQLGSPSGGEGSVCEAQSGGHWYPPRVTGS